MTIDAEKLKALIAVELATVSDMRVIAHIRDLLVDPTPVVREWDYGEAGERFPCWTVLNHERSGTEIVFCEFGFGQSDPWGFVPSGSLSMGMDSQWYQTFLAAYFASGTADEVPIWRAYHLDTSGARRATTAEHTRDEVRKLIQSFQMDDPLSQYECDHNITYEGDERA